MGFLKTKRGLWELIFGAHPVFLREEEEKGEKKLGFGRDQALVGFGSRFFPLKDQATWKGRFEEIQGKKKIKTLSSYFDLDFGGKTLTLEKRFFY